MKFHLAAIVLPAAVFLTACNETAPPDRDSQNTSIGNRLNSPVAGRTGRAEVQESVNIPQGAAWTICCDTISTPDHVTRAAELKSQLIQLTGRKDFYVVHKEGESLLYYGFYKAIREDVDPAEHRRSQADLQIVRTLTDSHTGQPIFREPIMWPIDGPDPGATPQWNLTNAPADAFWSLQIAAYTGADRKQAAVDSVRAARKMNIPAYYFHGDTVSSVCIGLWPVTAVQNQADDPHYGGSGHTVDPNQPLLVIGGSSAPDNISHDVRDAQGNKVKVMGLKLEILDPSLRAAIAKYPHEAVNGELHYKPLSNGEKFFDQTFLVQVPHEKSDGSAGSSEAAMPDNNLPVNPDDAAPPDPTSGALKSLENK